MKIKKIRSYCVVDLEIIEFFLFKYCRARELDRQAERVIFDVVIKSSSLIEETVSDPVSLRISRCIFCC